MSMVQTDTAENRVSYKNIAMTRTTGGGGSLVMSSFGEVVAFAELMSRSQHAIPAHLRNNPGACMAVTLLALRLEMDPFALASKSYSTKEGATIAYEAQMFAAIIHTRAPIKRTPDYVFEGQGDRLKCTVSCEMKDGTTKVYQSPELGRIPVKNSPLWKGDPEQQIGYYSIRAWARRYCPEVILGIYTPEEINESPPLGGSRAAAPAGQPAPRGLQGKLDALTGTRDAPRDEKVFTQASGDPQDGQVIDRATSEPANDDTATGAPDYEAMLAALEEELSATETEPQADAALAHAGWVQDAPQDIAQRAAALHTSEVDRIKMQAAREPDPHDDLRELARKKASGGRQIYNRWFSSKSDDDRKVLNVMAEELSGIAAEADRKAGRA